MAHEIALTTRGTAAMVYAGETPWHGLGVRFDAAPTIEQAIAAVEADAPVSRERLMLADGTMVNAWAVLRHPRAGEVQIVGDAVGQDHTTVADTDVFEAARPIIDANAGGIETAMYLRDHRVFVLTLRMRGFEADIVKNDPIASYAMFVNSHDGSLKFRAGLTTTRIVCANTLRGALASNGSKGNAILAFRHTKGARDAVRDVGQILAAQHLSFAESVSQYRHLASKAMTAVEFREFARLAFPYTGKKNAVDSVVDQAFRAMGASTTSEAPEARAVDRLCELFEAGKGMNIPGVRGTRWGALNAITEYLTHEQGRTAESRVLSTQAGPAAKIAEDAFRKLLVAA